MSNRILTGTVEHFDGRYFVVVCDGPDVPGHLRSHNLTKSQMGSAVIGDTVILNYYSDHRMGYWFVKDVVK